MPERSDPSGHHVLGDTGASTNGSGRRVHRTTAQVIRDFSAKVGALKNLVITAVGLIVVGFMAHFYLGDVATQEDVKKASTIIEERVDKNTETINTVKTTQASVVKQLEGVERRDLVQNQQLFNIAVKVGARPVPGISADAGVHP
jgi:hypothetical protein